MKLSACWLWVIGAAIGLAWGGGPEWLLLGLLILPVAYGRSMTRWGGFVLMLGYFSLAARGLPGGAAVFFGVGSDFNGWAMWGASSVLLAAPYGVLWQANRQRRALGFVGAVLLTIPPPLGIIGWCNPVAVAGWLFPGSGYAGIALTLIVFGVLVHLSSVALQTLSKQSRRLIGLVAMVLLGASGVLHVHARTGLDQVWIGVDTSFSALRSGVETGGVDIAGQVDVFSRLEWIRRYATEVPSETISVMPETILGRFSPMVEFSLPDGDLRRRASGVFVGAEVLEPDGRYRNVLLGFGDRIGGMVLPQSMPVPVSMWKPFGKNGAVADLLGRDAVQQVGAERVAGLICYEQLLPWVMFLRARDNATLVLAVKNVWWARDTSIPRIQEQSVSVYARLFGWRVVTATNR